MWKLLSFNTEMLSAKFLWGSVLLTGEQWKYEKNSNFKNFESALYSTSGNMPLTEMFKFGRTKNIATATGEIYEYFI